MARGDPKMPPMYKHPRSSESHHLAPAEVVRVVVNIPEFELNTLRQTALRDGFDNLDAWLAWLGRARAKKMLFYTYDAD